MDKQRLIETLENTLQKMRDELAKNEGSTLQAMGSNIKLNYESFKAYLDNNDTARGFIDNMKTTVSHFESALKEGDKQLSASLLQKAESLLAEYRARG